MSFSERCCHIFEQGTKAYHVTDSVDATVHNPYPVQSIEFYLYLKHWIDVVQWHLEVMIHDPGIEAEKALAIKRRIDRSDMDRTDLVELIDSILLDSYCDVVLQPDATLNTESPGWAIDRLSLLDLKVYHLEEELGKKGLESSYREKCHKQLALLQEQRRDLALAIDQLLTDIKEGRKKMKVYKQFKIYL